MDEFWIDGFSSLIHYTNLDHSPWLKIYIPRSKVHEKKKKIVPNEKDPWSDQQKQKDPWQILKPNAI